MDVKTFSAGLSSPGVEERLAQLSPEKRALLDQRLRQQRASGFGDGAIPLRDRTRSAPLSFSQQRLWFLDRLLPGSPLYKIVKAFRLRGELDLGALETAFERVIERHESLRTRFVDREGVPEQVVDSPRPVSLLTVDLSTLAAPERERALENWLDGEIQRPFDLFKDLMLRAAVAHLGPQENVLLLQLHHIASDGASIPILYRDLAEFYRVARDGGSTQLPELSVQYADFAAWQRQMLCDDILKQQHSYWKERLRGVSPLNLPADRARTALSMHDGAGCTFHVPRALAIQLEAFAREERATLFMVLLAGLKALLYRYTGQTDITVGTPIANRNRPEFENLIGLFVTTLVLRTDLAGICTFRELVSKVREVCLEAYANQDIPFERLQLWAERDLSRTSLFQVLFVLHGKPGPKTLPELPGFHAEHVHTDTKTAKFDLNVSIYETDEGLTGNLRYDTELFSAGTIERMGHHLERLLTAAMATPDVAIDYLPLLTETERRTVTIEWSGSPPRTADRSCVHHLIEEQASRRPEAVAVVSGAEQLTYGELNRRANQLAYRLRAMGVVPESFVGVFAERSLNMITALLGILKSGAAFVPLDSLYPQERLAMMLEDARPKLIVTQTWLRPRLPATEHRMIVLDEDAEALAIRHRDNPASVSEEGHAAYVIYTSGSTGRPKGVVVEHRALASFTSAAAEAYGISANDRVLQFASLSFDAAVEEIYPTLTQGATLVLRNEEVLESASAFIQACERQKVTVLDLPTAFWHMLTAEMVSESLLLPESVRLVIIGGERARPERLEQWHQHVGGRVRLVNTYGPTEATVVATVHECTPATDVGRREVPIGRPLPHVQTYVLDKHQNPVPIGVVGELCIGGAGLARGYLNRPELTAERFVPNEFDQAGPSRLYRSGDLTRWLADGELEYVGRVDEQVKIRGYRVELGEIEAALNTHPAVSASAARVWGQEGEEQLVAYVVMLGKQEASARDLRAHLKERIPHFMVPSRVEFLSELPMAPAGKVDRRALPEPVGGEAPYVPPQTGLEEAVAGVFAEVLGVERVGAHDNFFELGGHSLLAMRVIARVREAFEADVPLRRFFEVPTVAALAELTETLRWAAQEVPAVPALPTEGREEIEI